jgi:scyllo-inositol 2-dehydrogenase (NADP+)
LDGDFLTVREVLPKLGDVLLFEAAWDRFRPEIKPGWREQPDGAAGLWNDLGPHMVDQALQLFGMPESVEADICAQRANARVDDYFDVSLHYGRQRARLCSSSLIADPRPRFAVHGTTGSFVKYGLDPQEAQLKSGLDPKDSDFALDISDGMLTFGDGKHGRIPTTGGRWLSFYEGVASAILDGSPVPVTAQEARDGLALISLARRSSELQQRLVVSDASSPGG